MAYAPRQFGPVMNQPAIEVASPLRSLSELAQMAGQVQQLRQNRTALEGQTAMTKALQEANGDFDTAAGTLRQAGRWAEASTLLTKSSEIRRAQQQELTAGLERTQRGFEQATGLLQGIEQAPPEQRGQLYQSVLPELRKALPQFSQMFPSDLSENPDFLKTAVTFGMKTSEIVARRKAATEEANAAFGKQGDVLARDEAVMKAIGTWLEDAETGEEAQSIVDTAVKMYGASPALSQRVGDIPKGPLAPEWKQGVLARLTAETAPKSPVEALMLAFNKGDTAGMKAALGLQRDLSKAQASPGTGSASTAPVTNDTVQAILKNPGLWNDLTPTRRDALLVPLSQAGFDFANAAKALTLAQRGTIERWRQDALANLEALQWDPVKGANLTEEAAAAARAAIEDSYRVQMGQTQATQPPPPNPAVTPPPVRPLRSSPSGPGPQGAVTPPVVGAVVNVRGQRMRVTQVYPDGNFDAEPVR